MKFVVYELWTTARVIEAADEADAADTGAPLPRADGLQLCNWHVVPVETPVGATHGARDPDCRRVQ